VTSVLYDLDHELSQLIALHRELRSPRYQEYPDCVKRAVVVAYAAHYRVLLEFFHDGRRSATREDVDCPKPADLRYSKVADGVTAPAWSRTALDRLCDADKLVGHLSEQRGERQSDWGRDADWDLLRPLVARLFTEVPDAASRLPNTAALIDPFGVAASLSQLPRADIGASYLEQLTGRMKQHGISQNALAKEMGVSPTQATRWFTNNPKRKVLPELGTIQRIAEAMQRLIARTAT
jgi:hypothetical protein